MIFPIFRIIRDHRNKCRLEHLERTSASCKRHRVHSIWCIFWHRLSAGSAGNPSDTSNRNIPPKNQMKLPEIDADQAKIGQILIRLAIATIDPFSEIADPTWSFYYYGPSNSANSSKIDVLSSAILFLALLVNNPVSFTIIFLQTIEKENLEKGDNQRKWWKIWSNSLFSSSFPSHLLLPLRRSTPSFLNIFTRIFTTFQFSVLYTQNFWKKLDIMARSTQPNCQWISRIF